MHSVNGYFDYQSYGGKTRMSAQKLKACGFPSFGSAAYLAPFFFFFNSVILLLNISISHLSNIHCDLDKSPIVAVY